MSREYVCNLPKKRCEFTDNSGNVQKRVNIEEEPTVFEKRANRLTEFVNALVNGDEISQLFIKHDLTEKAKKELIELQQAVIGGQIDKEKETLTNLRNEVQELNVKINELKNINKALQEEKNLLSTDVELLKKRKEILDESINSNLSRLLSGNLESLKDLKEELAKQEEKKKEEERRKRFQQVDEDMRSIANQKPLSNKDVLLLLDADLIDDEKIVYPEFVPFFSLESDHGAINDYLVRNPVNQERREQRAQSK